MADEAQDPETALALAVSRYASAHGAQATGVRLMHAVRALRYQAQVFRIHDRILVARLKINRAAVERLEVHDDDKADAIMSAPTPAYRGAVRDDAWLRKHSGYSIQEGGETMGPDGESKPTARQPPAQTHAAPTGAREARTREARGEATNTIGEPEATAAVLLAALVDDPARVDDHVETLAALPCGRWQPLRDWLLAQDESQRGSLHPFAQKLKRDMQALGVRGGGYSAAGWERAARALVARYGGA